MSDAYLKKYGTHYSAEKRSPAPCRVPNRTKNKRPRPFRIEFRWNPPWDLKEEPQWHKHKDYRTAEERDQALQKLRYKAYASTEYRAVDLEKAMS